MNKLVNESNADRIIRVVLGLVILALGWGEVVTGGWGTFFKVIGFLPLVTGILGVCPAYLLLHFRTNPAS